MILAFDPTGKCLERNTVSPAPSLAAFQANHGLEVILFTVDQDPCPGVPLDKLRGLMEAGQVKAVEPDPTWMPPDPTEPPTPVPDLLAELVAKVDKLPAGTIHETRLRDQKEFLKLWAIPWVKANPDATPEDAAQAILAALRTEFPADPICTLVYAKDPATGREDGLLMSYAESAHAAGLTPDPSWQALRGLIIQAPEQQLREALRKL
ncbi:MAG: hypothetical protein HY910_12160 [Desulfarculus sp.]|nr:hypothetical protein [Desulfarculus sp.]